MVESVKEGLQKATNEAIISETLSALWDNLIDAQDEVATLMTLVRQGRLGLEPGEGWLFRADQPPEKIKLEALK